MLCSVCGDPDAPRPTGGQKFTYGGVTHKAAECAAIASLGETPIRTKSGYVAKSGTAVCMACFPHGRQHTYTAGTDPHEGMEQRPDGRWLKPERPRGPDIGKRRPRRP